MAWYDEAVFYHIYPLGMTGAPKQNDYGEPVERLNLLLPWLGHIKAIGCNALYIGPLFESVGHGYETTDWDGMMARLQMLATDYPIKGLRPIGAAGPRGDGYSAAMLTGQLMARLAIKDLAEEGGNK